MPVRVLLVDDGADERFLMRTILGDDAEVEVAGEAAGARDALEALDACAPDVVVLDAMMPVVDGYTAAPELLARRPQVRILLCTAHVDEDVLARAGAAGIHDVIGKGDFGALGERVRKLAGG